MIIVQQAFEVPPEIYAGLVDGRYKQFGGVIRMAEGAAKGQIVKHLKPVADKAPEVGAALGAGALKFTKKNAKAFAVGAAVAGIALCVA